MRAKVLKSMCVRARVRKGRCSCCGRPGATYDHLGIRRFEFVPFWGFAVFLLYCNFWTYSSPTWAGKFLDEWTTLVMRSRLEPMKKFARTLRNHRELLLNYFRAKKQFSIGVVEGLNNKVKVTMRKSYGFRTFRITEIALYHVLGKLPEPELTHRFY